VSGVKRAERLIVFSRYPEPGKSKTRLIPTLGPEGAALLQQRMTEHALRRIRLLAKSRKVEVEVRYEGGSLELMTEWLGPEISYRLQAGGDLGVRMERAFSESFLGGLKRVVLVGTDCPGFTTTTIRSAFELLGMFDLVIGPAADGGYYLIGLRRTVPSLFVNIPWGSPEVRTRTLEIAERLGLKAILLEQLEDVDRPEDLAVWERAIELRQEDHPPRISTVIPTLNEEEHIGSTLASLEEGIGTEVIVVDGGSSDLTAKKAASWGARVLTTSSGRAGQMNAGALAAIGSLLLFLHGDTCLPAGFHRHVFDLLARPGTVAGAFELGIAGGGIGLRLVERMTNLRSRLLQLPYGDQALFLKKDLFHSLGGFPDIPIMEDFVFVRRLKGVGRVAIAPVAVRTSARRWQKLGIGRTTLMNQAVLLGYYLGIEPARLALWYRRSRKRQGN
jgi:rSAM/selenodomain-associated transferase 2/rSAM/selenodomain-associated transferase 1